MRKCEIALVTDRGGHLHNALMLVAQMGIPPDAIVTTYGPDIDSLRKQHGEVHAIPHLFVWHRKLRLLHPGAVFRHLVSTFQLARRLRPTYCVSLGASNTVIFCYWARLWGAKIIHVECMNQVNTPSVTGRMLYPIAWKFYVQWRELLPRFGAKAEYAGWVL